MVLIKKNVSMVFVIILLSLEGFYSMDKGKGKIDFDLSLSLPGESSGSNLRPFDEKSDQEKKEEVLKARELCLQQINYIFAGQVTLEDQIKFAFEKLTKKGPLENYYYAWHYYKYIFNFVFPGIVRDYDTYTDNLPIKYHQGPNILAPYENLIEQLKQPKMRVFQNMYYDMTKDMVLATEIHSAIGYFKLLLDNYYVYREPYNADPYLEPPKFCKKFIKMPDGIEEPEPDTEPGIVVHILKN